MKIINATLNNDTITITLDAKANVHKIYLDSIINQKNMYSDEDDKHTHVISDFVAQDNTVIVNITEYNETSFIVSVLTSEGNRDEAIAIDQNELYLAKVNLLTTYCNTCLDKHQKHIIMMCDFRSQLLQYALEHNLTKDAIEHYIDLSRMLGMIDYHNCSKCLSPNKVCKCCNGMCAL